jgi:hypothetical protein
MPHDLRRLTDDTLPLPELVARLERAELPAKVWRRLYVLLLKRFGQKRESRGLAHLCALEAFQVAFTQVSKSPVSSIVLPPQDDPYWIQGHPNHQQRVNDVQATYEQAPPRADSEQHSYYDEILDKIERRPMGRRRSGQLPRHDPELLFLRFRRIRDQLENKRGSVATALARVAQEFDYDVDALKTILRRSGFRLSQ